MEIIEKQVEKTKEVPYGYWETVAMEAMAMVEMSMARLMQV